MDEYESVLLVKNEVFVFKIPPRPSNRGYRASEWDLATPQWTGRMRLVVKGNVCLLKLEDKTSGELFAQCPIDQYPGVAIESVTDSSRYFVARIQNDNGRSAFIGLGFSDRGDSFDLNVSLQDHFKWLEKSKNLEKEATEDSKPQLDLSFKEGQTITINLGQKKYGTARPKPSGGSGGGMGLLPPPPGGVKIPPARATGTVTPNLAPSTNSNATLLLDLDMPKASAQKNQMSNNSDWGDFASASFD